MAKLKGLFLAITATSLAACGSSGGGGSSTVTPTPAVISGTVAAGTALTGSVSVYDSSANPQPRMANVTIGNAGQYSATVTGFTAPFLLAATGQVGGKGATVTYYSVATGSGTVNITPLTTLMVLNMAAGNVNTLMTGSSGGLAGLTSTDLSTQNSNLDKLLAPVLGSVNLASGYDFFATAFTVGSSGYDQLLDSLTVALTNPAAVTVTNNTAPGTPVTIDTATGNPGGTFSIPNGPTTLPVGTLDNVSVPNVVGDAQAAATSAITAANLVLGTVTKQASSTVASGDVIGENPVASTSVAKGSSVALIISSGPAPAAYSIGGTVIGLAAGNTVNVTNAGDNLAVTANGSFTLATSLPAGGTYTVAVGTQLANQSCAVKSGTGSGTVASANVTSVVVFCTYNVTAATLNTTYTSVGIQFDDIVSGVNYPYAYLSADTFDGVSAVSSTFTVNTAGSIAPGQTSTSTYAVTTTGAIPVETDNSPGLGGIEGANGGAIVTAEGMAVGTQPSLYVAVKPNTTANSFNGTVTEVFIGVDNAGTGITVGEGSVTLNGGMENGTLTTNDQGTLGSNPFTNNPYTVASGVFSTSSLQGPISADGDLIVATDLNSGDNPGVAIFVVQGVNESIATLRGVYSVVSYGANGIVMTNPVAGAYTFFADGKGNLTLTGTHNSGGALVAVSGSGTYSVTSNGTLTLTLADGTVLVGAVSADGNALALADVGLGDEPLAAVGVRQ